MILIKADRQGRLRIPGIKVGCVSTFEDKGNGVYVLTEVKQDAEELPQKTASRKTGRKITTKK